MNIELKGLEQNQTFVKLESAINQCEQELTDKISVELSYVELQVLKSYIIRDEFELKLLLGRLNDGRNLRLKIRDSKTKE